MRTAYRHWYLAFFAVAVLSLIAASVLAQGGMRCGRRGMGPGMHGRGMYGRGMQGRAMWSVPGVTDSSLTADQRQRISAIRQETRTSVHLIRSNPSLSVGEKDRQIEAARTEGHRRVMEVLTPQQRQQVHSTWQERGMGVGPGRIGAGPRRMGMGPGRMGMGPAMGSVPGVPESSLTPDQRQRIAAIRQGTMQRVQSIRSNPNLSPQEQERQIQDARAAGHRQIMDILTPEQQQQFTAWAQKR